MVNNNLWSLKICSITYFPSLLAKENMPLIVSRRASRPFVNLLLLFNLTWTSTQAKGIWPIASSMAKQYETVIRNYVCSTYEDRIIRHILNVLSEKISPYFCGDSLTVKQRKSLAKHIFQQKINPKSAWPSNIDRIERHETIVNSFLTFWSM